MAGGEPVGDDRGDADAAAVEVSLGEAQPLPAAFYGDGPIWARLKFPRDLGTVWAAGAPDGVLALLLSSGYLVVTTEHCCDAQDIPLDEAYQLLELDAGVPLAVDYALLCSRPPGTSLLCLREPATGRTLFLRDRYARERDSPLLVRGKDDERPRMRCFRVPRATDGAFPIWLLRPPWTLEIPLAYDGRRVPVCVAVDPWARIRAVSTPRGTVCLEDDYWRVRFQGVPAEETRVRLLSDGGDSEEHVVQLAHRMLHAASNGNLWETRGLGFEDDGPARIAGPHVLETDSYWISRWTSAFGEAPWFLRKDRAPAADGWVLARLQWPLVNGDDPRAFWFVRTRGSVLEYRTFPPEQPALGRRIAGTP